MNFHDAVLIQVQLGPRREVQLEFLLDPVWNPCLPTETVVLRCGAIENYSLVEKHLQAILAETARRGIRVDRLEHLSSGVILELDLHAPLEIVSRMVSVFHGTSGQPTA